MKRIRGITYLDGLLLLFMAGSAAGCMIANLLSGELLRQLGYFDLTYTDMQTLDAGEKNQLWLYTLKRRMSQLALGGLIGMTPFARAAFFVLAFSTGFGCSVMISTCTLLNGWQGLTQFLRAVLPQGLPYMAVICLMAAASEQGLEKMKVKVWLLLALLTLLGTWLESGISLQILQK